MIARRLRTVGLLGLLVFCAPPTHIHAGESANPDGCHLAAIKETLIIAGIVTIYLAHFEAAQFLAAKAALRFSMACLRLLMKLPLSDAMKQKIKDRIDDSETAYITCVNADFDRQHPNCFGMNQSLIRFFSATH